MVKLPDFKKLKASIDEEIQETVVPYGRLLPYLKPYRWRFGAGVLCGALAGVVSGLLGLVIKHVTSVVFPQGAGLGMPTAVDMFKNAGDAASKTGVDMHTVIWTCSLIPFVMLLRSTLAYLNAYCVAWVSMKLLNDLKNSLFDKVIHQSMDFFNRSQSGSLIARVVNDARVAQGALTTISSDLVVQPFTIISAICGLLYLDWKFTLASFVLFPVCLVPIVVFGKRVRREGMTEEAGTGDQMVVIQEAFLGIRVVKALGREAFEKRDFVKAGDDQFRIGMRVRKAMEIVGPLIEAVSAVGVGMALAYCALGGITADRFLGLLTGLFMLYDPVKKLSKVHLMIQKALGSTARIFELMDLTPSVEDTPNPRPLGRVKGEIEFHNVTFGYRPDAPLALDCVNLRIQAGKTYALVGSSGSGKSTMLSMILRFYDPLGGTVLVDGVDLRTITQSSLRANVAIVTQDTFLFNTTIMENIRYGRLDATDEEVYAAAEQAFAHEFVLDQPNGYETIIGDKGCNLSGGQQQRIAIARALLRNAPILLLDEATSALDSESEQKIQIALERLSAGRTVIAIAHRLSTILKADQIIAMSHGKILEKGTHAELFEQGGHYRRLYDLQFNRSHSEEMTLVN
jgi:subfamily B ATP-binding cassette protein MsbA